MQPIHRPDEEVIMKTFILSALISIPLLCLTGCAVQTAGPGYYSTDYVSVGYYRPYWDNYYYNGYGVRNYGYWGSYDYYDGY